MLRWPRRHHHSILMLFVDVIYPLGSYSRSHQDEDGQTIVWKDPTTGKSFIVDTRTGHSYPKDAPSNQDGAEEEPDIGRRTLTRLNWLKKSKDPSSMEDVAQDITSVPRWLEQALQVCLYHIASKC